MNIPEEGSEWLHTKTGNTYTVMCVANLAADKGGWFATVVYKGSTSDNIWSRPLSEWYDRYEEYVEIE